MKNSQTQDEISKALEDFRSILKGVYPHTELDGLLLSFEKEYIQQSRISFKKLLRTFLFSCLYQQTTPMQGKKEMVYFWPFQFHHCDFMIPVIKILEKNNVSYRVLAFRENLIPYCATHKIKVDLIPRQRKARGFSTALRYLISFTILLFKLIAQLKPIRWKRAALNSLINIGAVEYTKQAAHAIALSESDQYHMIGFDLSLHGQALLEEFSALNIRTGRIQNGAANYLLSRYSKVDEIFFWDELSARPYKDSSWQGTAHIVGNLQLTQKVKAGPKASWQQRIEHHPLSSNCIILVAFSGAGHKTTLENHLQSLDYLEQLVSQLKTILFIVKLHPKDKTSHYERFKTYSNVLLTFELAKADQPDALDALMTAEILITGASTVALDALSLGKKVISIDPKRELSQFQFLQSEGIYLWEDESRLTDVLEMIRTHTPSNDNLERLYTMDPCLQIAEIITQNHTM